MVSMSALQTAVSKVATLPIFATYVTVRCLLLLRISRLLQPHGLPASPRDRESRIPGQVGERLLVGSVGVSDNLKMTWSASADECMYYSIRRLPGCSLTCIAINGSLLSHWCVPILARDLPALGLLFSS